jgi:hypothetical protein
MHKNKNLHTVALAVFSFIVLCGAILPAVVGAAPGTAVPDLYVLFPNRRHPVASGSQLGDMVVKTGTLGGADLNIVGSDGVTPNIHFSDDETQSAFSVDITNVKIPVGLGGNLTVSPLYLQPGDRVTIQGVLNGGQNNTVIAASIISDPALLKRGFYTGKVVRIDAAAAVAIVRLNTGELAGVDMTDAFAAVSVKGRSGPILVDKISPGDLVSIFGYNLRKLSNDPTDQKFIVYQYQVYAADRALHQNQITLSIASLSVAQQLASIVQIFSGSQSLKFADLKEDAPIIHADYIVDLSSGALNHIDVRLVNKITGKYECYGLDCSSFLAKFATPKTSDGKAI